MRVSQVLQFWADVSIGLGLVLQVEWAAVDLGLSSSLSRMVNGLNWNVSRVEAGCVTGCGLNPTQIQTRWILSSSLDFATLWLSFSQLSPAISDIFSHLFFSSTSLMCCILTIDIGERKSLIE